MACASPVAHSQSVLTRSSSVPAGMSFMNKRELAWPERASTLPMERVTINKERASTRHRPYYGRRGFIETLHNQVLSSEEWDWLLRRIFVERASQSIGTNYRTPPCRSGSTAAVE